MKKILFVCSGNTCRSPMAEIVLKAKLKNAGIKGVYVTSAGLMASNGAKMSENSFLALKSFGYIPYGFKSKQITEKLIKSSAMVICMTKEHKRCLTGFENVYSVYDISKKEDISDPFGGDLSVYKKTLYQIEELCNTIIYKLLKVKGE